MTSARDVIADRLTISGWYPKEYDIVHPAADAILAVLDAAGFAVVPKEPTEKMYFGFYSPDSPSMESVQSLWIRRYKAMLTAAKEKETT